MRRYTNFGLMPPPAFFRCEAERSRTVSRQASPALLSYYASLRLPSSRTSPQLQAKTEDAINNDDLLTDDASMDDDFIDEKIIPEGFVDDANIERIRAMMKQRSLWADI
jgi:hypothetical protein